MLKIRIFDNPKEDDINEFLKTTNGQLVDIRYTESVAPAAYGMHDIVKHSSIMILYEVSGPGGMKLVSTK